MYCIVIFLFLCVRSQLQAILPGAQWTSSQIAGWWIFHVGASTLEIVRFTEHFKHAHVERPQSECHPETCTQMTATEQWIFLCAAHKTPKEVSFFPNPTSHHP